jgi:cell wall-associated NlpC family hydrolase
MGKHTLKVDSPTGGQKVASTATAIVLSTGLIVAIEDSLDSIPVYPSDTQPIPIIPSNYAEAATQFGKSASAMQQITQTPIPVPTPTEQTAVVQVEAQVASTTTPKPSPVPRTQTVAPKPPPPPQPAVDKSIIGIARAWIGKNIPYLFGGGTLRGMDCSHFVWEVLKDAGYNVPYRNSSALKAWATPISKANALPGDLIFWPGHVGFYAGNNQVIDHGSGYGPKLRSLWGSPTFGRIP